MNFGAPTVRLFPFIIQWLSIYDAGTVQTLASGFTNPLWLAIDQTHRELYLIESNQQPDNALRALRRFQLDGVPAVETLLTGAFTFLDDDPFWWLVTGLAVDEEHGRIYWSDNDAEEAGQGRISWIARDGSQRAVIARQNEDAHSGLAGEWRIATGRRPRCRQGRLWRKPTRPSATLLSQLGCGGAPPELVRGGLEQQRRFQAGRRAIFPEKDFENIRFFIIDQADGRAILCYHFCSLQF